MKSCQFLACAVLLHFSCLCTCVPSPWNISASPRLVNNSFSRAQLKHAVLLQRRCHSPATSLLIKKSCSPRSLCCLCCVHVIVSTQDYIICSKFVCFPRPWDRVSVRIVFSCDEKNLINPYFRQIKGLIIFFQHSQGCHDTSMTIISRLAPYLYPVALFPHARHSGSQNGCFSTMSIF